MNKKVFTTKTAEDQEIELAVTRPSPKCQVNSQLEYAKAWALAEKSGSILRRNLDELAEKHSLWSDDLRKKVGELESEITKLELQLRGGAANFSSVEEAKTTALKIKSLRAERLEILRARNSLDTNTAEAFADSARLQYIVSQCTVYNDGPKSGQLYFKSHDDYISQSDTELALAAFNAYLELIYDSPTDGSDEAYEVKWLKKYKFIDNKERLIDKQGRYVSEDGRLIDEQYRYITEDNKLCDINGNLVDETGNYLIEYVEFAEGESGV